MKRYIRLLSWVLLISITTEIFLPTTAFALTSGPSQPEVQSFEPVTTTNMVDLATGDFNYNIPLMDVDGYPINISYHSGISMDQEASWVGLGWNINPGVINRNMRGLPDDFKGDQVTKKFRQKPEWTFGINPQVDLEIFGFNKKKNSAGKDVNKKPGLNIKVGIDIFYNNYRGMGFGLQVSPSFSFSDKAKIGLDLNSSTSGGASVGLSYGGKFAGDKRTHSLSLSSGFNSRTGLKDISLGYTRAKYTMTKVTETKVEDGKEVVVEKMVKNESKKRGRISSTMNFGVPTYVPKADFLSRTWGLSLAFRLGTTIMGIDPLATIKGYYTQTALVTSERTLPAYGYMNSEHAGGNQGVFYDFNREKEGDITVNTPRLPFTNFTYDIYQASGQGIAGTFRPYRSDVGAVHDPAMNTWGMDASLGVDLGVGNVAKFGGDVAANIVLTGKAAWDNDNPALGKFKFRAKAENDLFEPYYFREFGELSVDDATTNNDAMTNNMLGEDAVRVKLDSRNRVSRTTNVLKSDDVEKSFTSPIRRTSRRKRNQCMSFLTIEESTKHALEPSLYTTGDVKKDKPHHIGEVTILQPEGNRYIYGIPAYNLIQKEVTFASTDIKNQSNSGGYNSTGLIDYSRNNDNSLSNDKGVDGFYSYSELPAYAHSYLLTAILSSDYIDNDGIVGPSLGDMGTYTHFIYKKKNNFNWRTPIDKDKAHLDHGLSSVPKDNKGNYVYGEKEIWYLERIETKNYVAVFDTEPRTDGKGVEGENGGIGTTSASLEKLDNIKLYSRKEYDKFKANNMLTNAVPLKSVFFEYDYSLCRNLPNSSNSVSTTASLLTTPVRDNTYSNTTSGTGKLTLSKIFFTYQNSQKARFNPYTFSYSTTNPNYSGKEVDRWGTYLPFLSNEGSKERAELPYTPQIGSITRTQADNNSSAWTLNKIELPSGGQIEIKFESDDYAYVQDKRAMQMVKVAGFIESKNSKPVNKMYEGQKHYDLLVVDLPFPVSNKSELTNRYFSGVSSLFFKFFVNMNKGNGQGPNTNYEFVSGFVDFSDYDIFGNLDGNSKYTQAYIDIERVNVGDSDWSKDVNPITKQATQFCRLNLPDVAFNDPGIGNSKSEARKILEKLGGMFTTLKEFALGPNRKLISENKCKYFDANKSFVKLNNPDFKKLGGGCRVKEITINDNANNLLMGASETIGQNFVYETTEEIGGNLLNISSGVASYEPLNGGDELPQRMPVAVSKRRQQRILVADDDASLIDPMGESVAPPPVVIYSNVKVSNNIQGNANIADHGTGYEITEYYTSKDFPTLFKSTDIEPKMYKPWLFKLLKVKTFNNLDMSQGYAVTVNDMAGKLKSKSSYSQSGLLIDKVSYNYKTNPNNSKELDNKVNVINKSGDVLQKTMGVDIDMIADTKEERVRAYSPGILINGDVIFLVFFVLPVPGVLPSYTSDHTRLRTMTVSKVISKHGILESITAEHLGSKITTYNRAFDSETGSVLVTETQNDFHDPVYNITYPAHWAYDLMGPAYKNIGLTINAEVAASGQLNAKSQTVSDFIYENLVPGDELISTDNARSEYDDYVYYVVNKSVTPDGKKIFMRAGNPRALTEIGTPNQGGLDGRCRKVLTGSFKLKVIRSGRRNMQINPVMSVTTLTNPIKKGGTKLLFTETDHVLSSSAMEYSDEWRYDCTLYDDDQPNSINPYYEGSKGIFRPKKSFAYLVERNKDMPNGRRKDGSYSFSPYWIENSGKDWYALEDGWQVSKTVTDYNQYLGAESENLDPIGNYSSASYGYNQTRQVLVVGNSKTKEVGYFDFEEFPNQFSTQSGIQNATLDNVKSHTGVRSLKIPANGPEGKLLFKSCCHE